MKTNINIPKKPCIVTMFTLFDDLVQTLFGKQKGRPSTLTLSEVATIILLKQSYGIPTWLQMYLFLHQAGGFHLPCYKNFVETMNRNAPKVLFLVQLLLACNRMKQGKTYIVDSTPLPVCKNMRIERHKVMKGIAHRSKSTTGWFYGMKLHLLIDLMGNIVQVKITSGNCGDRKVLEDFLEQLEGSIVLGDAGYLSQELQQKAGKQNNKVLTGIRKNMKKIATLVDISLLNLRGRVESVFSVLKSRCGLVTSLPRSITGYLAHYIFVIFGYLFKPLFFS